MKTTDESAQTNISELEKRLQNIKKDFQSMDDKFKKIGKEKDK